MTSTSSPRSCLRFARRLAPVVMSVSLVACGSSGGTTNGTAMTDTNNYAATSSLNIPVIPTAAATDLTLDWSGITKDLLCHTAAPIGSITFAAFPNKTKAAVEAELAIGKFDASEVHPYFVTDLSTQSPPSSMMLSQLGQTTKLNPLTDYTESSSTVYLLLFSEGTKLGHGAESMVILQPTASNTNTKVMAPDACASNVLSFSATLGAPLTVPKSGPYKIDWSKLTHDGFNQPIQFGNIDSIELGYFASMDSLAIMNDFLDVEQNATTLYTAPVTFGDKSVDLTTASANGAMFTSYTTPGTWALALMCSSCSAPAPVGFAILSPQ